MHTFDYVAIGVLIALGLWAGVLLYLMLFSADSAKDRSVANVRHLAVFLQPFG